MTLAIGWLHEAGDPPHPALRGGSMTLAIRWLHEGGETLGTWLHEAGDWHRVTAQAPKSSGCALTCDRPCPLLGVRGMGGIPRPKCAAQGASEERSRRRAPQARVQLRTRPRTKTPRRP